MALVQNVASAIIIRFRAANLCRCFFGEKTKTKYCLFSLIYHKYFKNNNISLVKFMVLIENQFVYTHNTQPTINKKQETNLD